MKAIEAPKRATAFNWYSGPRAAHQTIILFLPTVTISRVEEDKN
jgi:hypothetical protein